MIFLEGSTGNELYMLISGELEVIAKGTRLGFLSNGAFFGEVQPGSSFAQKQG